MEASFRERFDQVVTERGIAPYLIFYDESGQRTTWSYQEFSSLVYRTIGLLQQSGIRRCGRVAIVSENRPGVLITYFACWVMGACACPVNVEERLDRKRFILHNSGATVALVEDGFLGEIRQLQPAVPKLGHILAIDAMMEQKVERGSIDSVPLDTPAFLVYTSGTTGDPKGVLLRQSNLLANAHATVAWHGLQLGDGLMTVLPIHHVNGAIVTGLVPFLAGGRNILNRRFSPTHFWQRMATEKAVIASMVPTLLTFLLSADEELSIYDLNHVRYLLCGAGPLLSETVIQFEDRFQIPICHGFGMSETTAYNTQMPMDLTDSERQRWYTIYDYPSIGCAIDCNEVAILRPDRSEAEPLERGEIAIKGPTVMSGYMNNPTANAAAFYGDWFLSGDQGFYQSDDQGRTFFFLSGRIKELIIRGGVNISPLEIDEILQRFPGVAFALAIPFENVYYGEEVAAYVVPVAGESVDEIDLLVFAQSHLTFAKCPKVILFGEEVPFTTTGKPKRIQLANELAEQLLPYRERQFRSQIE